MRSFIPFIAAISTATAVLFEAELGVRTGNVTIEKALAGYTGTGYIAGFQFPADTVNVPISVPAAGNYDISLIFSAQFGDKFTTFSIDGGAKQEVAITNTTTSNWDTVLAGSFTLTSGAHQVLLENSWAWYYIDSISVVPTPPKAVVVVDVTNGAKAEAEDGIFKGTSLGKSAVGFSGTGYVEGFDADGDTVTLTVSTKKAGIFDIIVRYSGPYGAKQTVLVLNGGASNAVIFEDTTGSDTPWRDANGGQVLLNVGENTLQFQNAWGYYLIDYIKVTPAAAPTPHSVSAGLVNPTALPVAKALYNKLLSKYGSGEIFSGQAEVSGVTWLEANVGKTPAIIGLDLIDYSPSRVEFQGNVSKATEEAIAWDARNGIVSIQWHWNAPTDLVNNATVLWWSGFYTYGTTFDLPAALVPTSANYKLLLRDIDAIAVQLLRLQAAGVPVLWRPLHEADGGWFWWGAHGPENCKALYKIVYDRLTVYHKLRNLIWVWNSPLAAWYPGDNMVDIVGIDSYPPVGDHGPLSVQYKQLIDLVKDKKMVTLPEVGTIPDPDLLKLYKVDWSYFVTWSGEFIDSETYNSLAFKKKLYQDPTVLKLSDLGPWKGAVTTTVKPTTTTTMKTMILTTRSTTRSVTPTIMTTSSRKTTTTLIKTTPKTTTPSRTTTKVVPTPTSAGPVTPTQTKYGQCGGQDWKGPTVCATGLKCNPNSPPWYYQCL